MRNLLLIAASLAVGGWLSVAPERGATTVHAPLFVGSFNIQDLTDKKFNRPHVMDVVEKVILRYDLILIMEIMVKDDKRMNRLLMDLNAAVEPDDSYAMTIGDRRFNGTREHYAFLYKKNKLRLIGSESYQEESVFYRKPLIAIFEALTLRDMSRFVAVGHHVKPDAAVREINALADVYDYIKWHHGIEDVLLMGDFNADCSYVKEKDWETIALWYRPEFTWAITSSVDTTTNYRSCTLDRFVYAGEKMNDGVILSSARAFQFQKEYDLSTYEVRNISDHWPIELKIRGKLSEIAQKYLTAEECFQVHDTQPRKNNTSTETIFKMARKSFFDARITSVDDGSILLTNVTFAKSAMLDALTRLRLHLPTLVSQELEEAVKYKSNHGALNDDSSFVDNDDYNSKHTIHLVATEKIVTASVCKVTSVN